MENFRESQDEIVRVAEGVMELIKANFPERLKLERCLKNQMDFFCAKPQQEVIISIEAIWTKTWRGGEGKWDHRGATIK